MEKTLWQGVAKGVSIRRDLPLLVGSDTTNFIYRLVGRQPYSLAVEQINLGSKIVDRIHYVRSDGYMLDFVGIEGRNLFDNLQLIDSELPRIVAYLVEYMYAKDEERKLSDLLIELKVRNPLRFPISKEHPFYEYKVTRLLVALAMGMNCDEVWTGEIEKTGRNIVVEDGDTEFVYTPYQYDAFVTFLLNNTRLEQADMEGNRYGFFYREGNEVFIKLNLQIRFT